MKNETGFIYFVLFLVFLLKDVPAKVSESNGLHFSIFGKTGCCYKNSSISNVNLKFVFSRPAMTSFSAKIIRGIIR